MFTIPRNIRKFAIAVFVAIVVASCQIAPTTYTVVEGTALGNVLMQMKASGSVRTLEQMRRISAESVNLVTYLPIDPDKWDEEYKRYLEITSKA